MDPYIGKMLDNRYEILGRIGTGGMAVVYKAKCHRLNRLVAIKILKSDLAQDEDFRRRFNAESQAVAQLSHPNIVSVYDVSRGGDTEYIVMELIDGITLKQYMEKRGQLNWRESLHFITQIMRGLSHAHSRGIVHRDIKPQNVMVLRDGSVKVADFGIACLENAAQTLTQEALGSVHYISPEQARGDRTDARSDVYSAGVVFYEMLTGRLPFEGDSAVSVAIQHLSSIPLAPREIKPDIPEQLELICMKAMAPDLDKRYPSADAMIADLESFRKNPDVSMDFQLEDLRPDETDEPTRMLRTAGPHPASSAVRSARERETKRERRRDDYYDDEPAPRASGKRIALISGVTIVAVVALFFLFRAVFSSFGTPVQTEFEVPNLLGQTLEEAEAREDIAGIFQIVVDREEPSEDYGAGEISWQDPSAGDRKKGDNLVIHVRVSTGIATAEMPDLTERDVREARTELESLSERYGLELVIDDSVELQEISEEVEQGCVIRTEPAAGTTLEKGDTVRLIVSKGPQPVTVPPLTELDMEVAIQMLNIAELEYTVRDEYSDRPIGEVIRQTPEAGTEVAKGTEVELTVSKGAEPGSSESDGPGTYTVNIPLPTDRDLVEVQVYLDGNSIYQDVLDSAQGNFFYELEATVGPHHVQVYLDGELTLDEQQASFEAMG